MDDDQQIWHSGNDLLKALLVGLPADALLSLTPLLNRYSQTKEALAAGVAGVDAASVCRECKGQCCQNGKYRINVLDTLACVAAHFPLSADFTQKPVCPYGSDAGCSLQPGLRPADCVLFVCDAIDRRLAPQMHVILAELEQQLRECIHDASYLTGEPMGTPLLLWAANKNKSNSVV